MSLLYRGVEDEEEKLIVLGAIPLSAGHGVLARSAVTGEVQRCRVARLSRAWQDIFLEQSQCLRGNRRVGGPCSRFVSLA